MASNSNICTRSVRKGSSSIGQRRRNISESVSSPYDSGTLCSIYRYIPKVLQVNDEIAITTT